MQRVEGSSKAKYRATWLVAVISAGLVALLAASAAFASSAAARTPSAAPPHAMGHGSAGQRVRPATSTLTQTSWLVGRSAINLINAYWGNTSLTTSAFDSPGSKVTYGQPPGWLSEPTDSFDAVGPVTYQGSFLYALAHRLIRPGTKAVLLDLEDWSLSQVDEEREPAYFMDEFVTKAHLHGYQAILAPGIDLVRKMSCDKPSEPNYVNYLTNCDLPRAVGLAHPDVYEIQAQAFENNTSIGTNCECYRWFVDQAAAGARHELPGLQVFAALASNPEGRATTPQVLYSDTLATRPAVSGFSLNVPHRSVACPTCSAGGAPDVAADYLWMLGYTGTGARAQELQSYWLATSNGKVFAAGAGLPLGWLLTPSSDPVVGIATTADRRGYWLVTSDGGVAAFGDARLAGDLPRIGVHVSDVVAIAPTADGRGYWLIGRDGGEFAFGDADYHGSLPGIGVHVHDVVGMAATSTGQGYWVVGRDGGVFALGDARYVGSVPGLGIRTSTIRAMIPSANRHGYVLVGSDGGTFVFGTGVHYYGSLPGRDIHVSDVVGLALTEGGAGYWLAGADGSVYAFGNAEQFTLVTKPGRRSPVVAIAGS